MATSSLLAGLNCQGHVHLIVGTTPLAATRCTQSLGAGARPVLLSAPDACTPSDIDIHYGLRTRIDAGDVRWEERQFEDADLFRLGRDEVGGIVDAVFVTAGARTAWGTHISSLCRRNRIPVNVVDAPQLCSFTLLSVHTDGPLQIGITTNGRGCKLASRIRREVAASLPPGLGDACERLGEVRRRIIKESSASLDRHAHDDDDSVDQRADFNRLVTPAQDDSVRNRRMAWLSQVCEYWSLKKLASISEDDVETVLQAYHDSSVRVQDQDSPDSPAPGRLYLAGSGPGHPLLLTRATHLAILTADIILADKLVPSAVMDLIPRRTPVHIARKFPGNAERAQEELLTLALTGVRAGQKVLRLKQGDPFIYGRGGEEVAYFASRGLGSRVHVMPGVTSALSAPLFAMVPPTQRDVADQVLICTGTGKAGKAPAPPPYVPSQTAVFLMALHRIRALVGELTEGEKGRALWPLETPCAVVERASCPDQRVIRTTLARVADAIEAEGSRPPGLLVVGRACEALWSPGGDGGAPWTVEEGFRGLGLEEPMCGEMLTGATGLGAQAAESASS